MSEHALEEELVTIAWYTRRASAALALSGTSIWDALSLDQQREEKHQPEENVSRVMRQQDTYIQEIQTAFIFLTRISDISFPLIYLVLLLTR